MSLVVSHLTKHYAKKIHPTLHNLSFTVKPNTIYGLFGKNGIGKTTLINCIMNRMQAKGTVSLNDMNLWENQQAMNRIFASNIDFFYTTDLTIQKMKQNFIVAYPTFDTDLFNTMLATFQILETTTCKKLSTGQNQLIQNCFALCVDADYIFLDEPVITLDVTNRDLFYQFIIEAYAKRPRTIVIATHLINEIANIIEDFILLKDNQTVLQYNVEQLLSTSQVVTGSPNDINLLAQNYQTIILKKSSTIYTAVVFNVDNLLQNYAITASPLDLQTLFIALTQEVEK